jgi:hypothetical protein
VPGDEPEFLRDLPTEDCVFAWSSSVGVLKGKKDVVALTVAVPNEDERHFMLGASDARNLAFELIAAADRIDGIGRMLGEPRQG